MYVDIRWTTRDLAGVNAGDGVNHITIPGSLTPSILDIEETSNVGTPGRWIFKVGEGMYPSSVEHNLASQIICSCGTCATIKIYMIHVCKYVT